MKRRCLLASLAATPALSGCLTNVVGTEDPTTGSSEDPSCPADTARRVTLVETADLSTALDISMSATVVRDQSTAEAPATISVQLTNDGDRREVTLHGGKCDPFNRASGKSDPQGLWLYEESERPDERVDVCWTRPDSGPHGFDGYACGGTMMASGATRTWTYEVWDDAAVEGYYPTGTYRFRSEVAVGEGVKDAIEWWLDLRVSTPDG